MKKKILELHEQGLSYSQIREKLGCSKGTIAYHLGVGCKERTYRDTKDRRNKIRRLIQEVKTGKPCTDCGESYPYWIMEFDHIGDNKKFTIGQFRTYSTSMDIIKTEIEKCEIVCANCHRNRTFHRLWKTGANTNCYRGKGPVGRG